MDDKTRAKILKKYAIDDVRRPMKWYAVRYKCGHTGVMQSTNEIDAKDYAETIDCDDCYEKEMKSGDVTHSKWMLNYYAEKRKEREAENKKEKELRKDKKKKGWDEEEEDSEDRVTQSPLFNKQKKIVTGKKKKGSTRRKGKKATTGVTTD